MKPGNSNTGIFCALLLGSTLVTLTSIVYAQQQNKAPVVGVLRNDTPELFASRNEALRQGLRELGYVEGETIRFEYRYAESNPKRLPQLVSELIRLKVDVIVVGGGTTEVARKATTTIPIIVGSAGDLVRGAMWLASPSLEAT